MALVLRMAGVPSRVVTGFTSGALDREAREYVVRDLDAHSWVEVWYPSVGWVVFDPTPTIASPRGQPEENRAGDSGATASAPPSLPGDVPSDPGRRALAEEAGTPWGWIAAGVAGGLALAAALVLLWRGRRRRVGTAPGGRRARRARARAAPHASATRSGHHAALARAAVRPAQPRGRRLRAGAERSSATAAARSRRRPRSAAACAPSSPAGTVSQVACGPGGHSRRERDSAYNRGSMDDVYDLFTRGTALLEAGDFNSATVPLSKAAELEPEKASIREALGRAYFRSRQFEAARVEFAAVVELAPTNDYALFCLGRALMELGRPAEARKPLALAAQLRPERRDYRIYRERRCEGCLNSACGAITPAQLFRPKGPRKAGARPLFS